MKGATDKLNSVPYFELFNLSVLSNLNSVKAVGQVQQNSPKCNLTPNGLCPRLIIVAIPLEFVEFA